MECVPGESLAAKLRYGPLTVKDATSIALQIAEALEEAHEQGVIHRDLKPGNVMVTPKGQVKVLDFGIAKLLEVQTADETLSLETRGIVGTPLYMSPEQAMERGWTHERTCGVWASCTTNRLLVTGRSVVTARSQSCARSPTRRRRLYARFVRMLRLWPNRLFGALREGSSEPIPVSVRGYSGYIDLLASISPGRWMWKRRQRADPR